MHDFLIIQLGKAQYAFELKLVVRVIPSLKVVSIPGVPAFFEGVINVGGVILPVLNLFEKFNVKSQKRKIDQKYIIIKNKSSHFVLVVDDVLNVVHKTLQELLAPNDIINGLENYVEKVIEIEGEPIPVFELSKILSESEMALIHVEVTKQNEY